MVMRVASEPIRLLDDDGVDPAAAGAGGQEFLERRAIERCAATALVPVHASYGVARARGKLTAQLLLRVERKPFVCLLLGGDPAINKTLHREGQPAVTNNEQTRF